MKASPITYFRSLEYIEITPSDSWYPLSCNSHHNSITINIHVVIKHLFYRGSLYNHPPFQVSNKISVVDAICPWQVKSVNIFLFM